MSLRKRMAEVLEQEHNFNGPGLIVNSLLILLITLNVIAIFLETVDSVYAQYQQAFWYFEVFSVAVFTVEYFTRVWCCIDLDDSADPSPVRGRIKYILSPMALIDLVAILPFYLSLHLAIDLRFVRVLRLLRLLKITRYSPAMGALLDVVKKELDTLLAAFTILLMMLVVSSAGIYLLENELQPDTFGDMPSSMWWSIITLTTVGYGDVVPVTGLGKIFGGIISLLGIGMIALPAAIMASGFAENIQHRKQKYNRFVRRLLEDGKIDENERWKLEELRKELGLDSEESIQLLDTIMHEIQSSNPQKCPHCGEQLK